MDLGHIDGPGIGDDVLHPLLGVINGEVFHPGTGIHAQKSGARFLPAAGIGHQDRPLRLAGILGGGVPFQGDPVGNRQVAPQRIPAGRHKDRAASLRLRVGEGLLKGKGIVGHPIPMRAPVDDVGDGHDRLLGRIDGVHQVGAVDPGFGTLGPLVTLLDGKAVGQPNRALQYLERVGSVDASRGVHIGQGQRFVIEADEIDAVLQYQQRVGAVGRAAAVKIAVRAAVRGRLLCGRSVIPRPG